MSETPFDDPVAGTPAATDPRDPPNSAPDVAALKQERDDIYDRLLRNTAEFDNYRKRIERERREQADQGITDLLLDLLLIVDDFDLALSVETGDAALAQPKQSEGVRASPKPSEGVRASPKPSEGAAAYRKGVELIHGKLQDLLRRRGVRPIVALGADFDPNVHQAVVHDLSPDHREGEVIGELRRGYMLGDRLLRAALVKVAKA